MNKTFTKINVIDALYQTTDKSEALTSYVKSNHKLNNQKIKMSADTMDPIGERSDIIEVDSLTKWHLTQLPEYKEATQPLANSHTIAFPWRNDLNAKIAFWDGDPLVLNVHAVVNPTNETMNDRSGLCGRIWELGGVGLEQHVRAYVKGCKTGEAKITEGFKLLTRHVIHTVGPRYNIRYTTAAESALYSCYRNSLHLARENGAYTLALPCVHSLERGYPPEDGAHIAIRTVRRFLEKHGEKFELIVFVVQEPIIKEVYQELLPLYFPRSQDEADRAERHLPLDIGNEHGEPIIPERQIRIMDKPMVDPFVDDLEKSMDLNNDLMTPTSEVGSHPFTQMDQRKYVDDLEKSMDLNNDLMTPTSEVGSHPFTQMEEDVDKSKRVNAHRPSVDRHKLNSKRYMNLLQKSRTTDLSAIAALRCLYQSGVDRMGRPVIIFIGRNLPIAELDLEKVLLYFIQVMDPVVIKEYVIVYFHSLTRPSNRPDVRFLRTIYEVVDHKYKKNLKSFYVVHPTIWSKVATWFFTTFSTTGIKHKVQSLGGVEHLYSRVNPDQLDIPQFVLDYDIKINGRRYYVPSDREVKEAMEGL